MQLSGGKLKVEELKIFLESSYVDPAPIDIMGYKLDEVINKKININESNDGEFLCLFRIKTYCGNSSRNRNGKLWF